MASNAGPSKKKRDRTKDRQKRKEKRQQVQHEDSPESTDESPESTDEEEDIDPNAIYGPRGETKKQWDARVGDQPVHDASWAAFERRVKARRGKPIEYEDPEIPHEQVLGIPLISIWNSKCVAGDKIMKMVTFAPGVNVNDSHIDIIADADSKFREGVERFVAGDPTRKYQIDITDAGVEKLVKALPNLKVIALFATTNLAAHFFPTILKGCPDIEAVEITVMKSNLSKRTKLDETLNWLIDKDFVPKLRFLEFRGVYLNPNHRNFLDFLTKRRPTLEIVYEWAGEEVLIRDMESVPLARVPKRPTKKATKPAASSGKAKVKDDDEDDEDAWETEESEEEWEDDEDGGYYDDDLISKDPKANARMLKKLGQQAALSDALGRPLYEFEMDSDYGDYDFDTDDSDEGLDPQEMKQMLKLMRMM